MSRTRDISKLLNDSVTISTLEELATVTELDTIDADNNPDILMQLGG
jgi:hypothetical protein